MDLDKMKEVWAKTSIDAPNSRDRLRTAAICRQQDNRTRILGIYRRLSVAAAIMSVAVWMLYHDHIFTFRLCVMYSLFMLVMLGVNLYYMHRVRQVDLTVLPVRDAIIASSQLIILRNRIQMCSIPAAIIIIGLLLYDLWNNLGFRDYDPDHYAFWGCVAGGAFGLIMGISLDLKIRRMIRHMHADLESVLDDSED